MRFFSNLHIFFRSSLEKRMRLEEKIKMLNGGVTSSASALSAGAAVLPSTPPSTHPALDRASFRARLSSFAPTFWFVL